MISDELQEKVREAWYQAIPEQYRNTGKERKADYSTGDHPAALRERWLSMIEPHLTKDQLRAQANREKCGRPGAKKGGKA